MLILTAILIAGFLSIHHVFKYLSGYLAKSTQVNANILLIEGWLPDYALRLADEEFKKNGYDYMVTTGIKSTTDYYILPHNGYLVFNTRDRFNALSGYGQHSIDIDAVSDQRGDEKAHFNLYINDTLLTDFFVDKKIKKYKVNWVGNPHKVDSVLIQFTNAGTEELNNRNLYVKDIIFDHKTKIRYQNNTEYDIGQLDGKERVINKYDSYAVYARKRLIAMGVDSSLVIATPGKRTKINRTLTSALAFRNWLDTTRTKVTGVNIFTVGTHARRTWMTYDKILKGKYQVGVISIPDYINNNSKENKVLKTIRETMGILYYWIILIPY
jgi:hypothetical protein